MKKIFCGILMSVVLTLSSLSAVYAMEEPTPPPKQENYETNEEIDSYNSQVEEYNQQVDEYNSSIDTEYEEEKLSVDTQNAEILQHNEEEQRRYEEDIAYNETAVQEAEEENALIDEQNRQEEERVKQENAEREKQYESDLEQYNSDCQTYEEDLAQYEKDKATEEKILAAGYESVQQYNEMINTYYNEPANLSVEKNANAENITIGQTYIIEEAEVKSGTIITVTITHNFNDGELIYEDVIEIDANDVITFLPIAAVVEATVPNNATFYYNVDGYSMGYWMEVYSCVATAANYNENDWNCGDTHTISFKDGKLHSSDPEDIIVEYNYAWAPLRTYKTYNVPEEPVAPTAPTLTLEEFIPKEYVTPTLRDIIPADIWETLPAPVKKEYLTHLSLLPRLEEPVEEPVVPVRPPKKDREDPVEDPVVPQVNPPVPFIPMPAPAPAPAPAPNTKVREPKPATTPEPVITVTEPETPLAAGEGYWALVNLIITIVSIIIAILLFITWLIAHKKENEEDKEGKEYKVKYKTPLRIISTIIAIGLIILFLLTEDVTLPMRLFDFWTIPMAIILLIQIILMIFSKSRKIEKEEN